MRATRCAVSKASLEAGERLRGPSFQVIERRGFRDTIAISRASTIATTWSSDPRRQQTEPARQGEWLRKLGDDRDPAPGQRQDDDRLPEKRRKHPADPRDHKCNSGQKQTMAKLFPLD